jgi:hypothetical protein
MAQTGHRSVIVARRYIREGSLFREDAAGGVGLQEHLDRSAVTYSAAVRSARMPKGFNNSDECCRIWQIGEKPSSEQCRLLIKIRHDRGSPVSHAAGPTGRSYGPSWRRRSGKGGQAFELCQRLAHNVVDVAESEGLLQIVVHTGAPG